MEDGLQFRFAVPRPPQGPLVEMSVTEMEKTLLKRLEAEKSQPIEALWQLARFYQQSKQFDKGLACLRQVLPQMPDAESKARGVLALGQMMESIADYRSAVAHYKEAFAIEPVQTDAWYFINNNLGFSFNQLGQFGEGERYCRKAIEIDPNRPNGFKNLGLALSGQGDFREAARCFLTATQVNAADPRAFHLLRELLKQHPELEYEFQHEAAACQKAIEFSAKQTARLKPVVYRGWRKHLILLRQRMQSRFKRFWRRS